jgi:hypothetical protein
MTRRIVRATPEFFLQLDSQLPGAREGHLPSRSDFQAYDLLAITDRFATDWDHLPPLRPAMPDYRILLGTGRLVRGFSVVGRLASDGAIELLRLEIDTSPFPDPGDDAEQ